MDEYFPPAVISVHGIRTHANWQKVFAKVFSGTRAKILSFDYGYYGGYKLIFRIFNYRKVDEFCQWYHENLREGNFDNKNYLQRPSIAAHSFGTWIVGHAMLKYEDIKFSKVIFCGSILPDDFDWSAIFARDQVDCVRNEYGGKDEWPFLARLFDKRSRAAGTYGFKWLSSTVDNVLTPYFFHSDFLTEQHMQGRWREFLSHQPSPLSIVHGRHIQDNDIFSNTLNFTGTRIDPEAYGSISHYSTTQIPRGLSKRWIRINPDIYTFLFDRSKNEPAGYINAMPIDEETYKKIRNGTILDRDILPKNIMPFSQNESIKIYIMSIAIGENYRSIGDGLFHRSFVRLVSGFIEKIYYYTRQHQVKVTHFIAVAWTDDGIKMCGQLGMEKVGEDQFGDGVYEIEISKYRENHRTTPPLLRKLLKSIP